MGYFPVIRRPAPPVEAYWVMWEDPAIQQLLREALPVAQLHGRTAHQPMIDHSFFDEDRKVTRTVYQDGTDALVNFSCEPYEVEGGRVLAPRSYHLG
jgi:hypothetical protein